MPPANDSDHDGDVGLSMDFDDEWEEEAWWEREEEDEEVEERMEEEEEGGEAVEPPQGSSSNEDPWGGYEPELPSMFNQDEEVTDGGLLYEDASVTVLAASTFIWSLAKSAGWRREHVNELLGYMHHVLLPAGNKLPKTMYRLQQMIGDPNLSDCTYRMCSEGCLLWHRRDEWRLGIRASINTQCPKCRKPLFKESRGRIVPIQTCIYFGITSMIRWV